jgi:hypothetical protein
VGPGALPQAPSTSKAATKPASKLTLRI